VGGSSVTGEATTAALDVVVVVLVLLVVVVGPADVSTIASAEDAEGLDTLPSTSEIV
jgi:hypothetical protein